jgi:hypothetical protein
MKLEMNHMYTYDEQTLSDLHKDARGFRPRGEYFWARWNESNDDGKQAIWDNLIDEMKDSQREDALREAKALEDFKARIVDVIGLGAGDRETALRWMTDREHFFHSQSVESWVWDQGILFTDYGRKLVEEIMEIVTFEEYS